MEARRNGSRANNRTEHLKTIALKLFRQSGTVFPSVTPIKRRRKKRPIRNHPSPICEAFGIMQRTESPAKHSLRDQHLLAAQRKDFPYSQSHPSVLRPRAAGALGSFTKTSPPHFCPQHPVRYAMQFQTVHPSAAFMLSENAVPQTIGSAGDAAF